MAASSQKDCDSIADEIYRLWVTRQNTPAGSTEWENLKKQITEM